MRLPRIKINQSIVELLYSTSGYKVFENETFVDAFVVGVTLGAAIAIHVNEYAGDPNQRQDDDQSSISPKHGRLGR